MSVIGEGVFELWLPSFDHTDHLLFRSVDCDQGHLKPVFTTLRDTWHRESCRCFRRVAIVCVNRNPDALRTDYRQCSPNVINKYSVSIHFYAVKAESRCVHGGFLLYTHQLTGYWIWQQLDTSAGRRSLRCNEMIKNKKKVCFLQNISCTSTNNRTIYFVPKFLVLCQPL